MILSEESVGEDIMYLYKDQGTVLLFKDTTSNFDSQHDSVFIWGHLRSLFSCESLIMLVGSIYSP